jgi:hypothetical protein
LSCIQIFKAKHIFSVNIQKICRRCQFCGEGGEPGGTHLQATTAQILQSSNLSGKSYIWPNYLHIMASLFFSTPVDIDVVLEDLDERQTVDVKLDKGRRERVPLYMDGESVKGAVTIRPKDGKRLEHTGIKVQFIGTIGA